MDLALAIPHVEHAAAYVEGKALLVHEGNGEANVVVIVRGVDPATLQGVSDVVGQTGYGSFSLDYVLVASTDMHSSRPSALW